MEDAHSPASLILPDHAAWLYSPYTWATPTGRAAATINAGAYLRVLFSGPSAALHFDVGANRAPLSQVYTRVDGDEAGSPWRRASVAPVIEPVVPAETAGLPFHLLELVVKSTSETINRWQSPSETAVVFTGMTLARGARVALPRARQRRLLILGDSITEGVRTINETAGQDTDRNDVTTCWSWAAGRGLPVEFGIVGFGGAGLTHGGSGGVPALGESIGLVMAGAARRLEPAPDLVVLNYGTNDRLAAPAAVEAALGRVLAGLLAGTPESTAIAVLRPFNGTQAAALQRAATGSARVSWVDTTGIYDPAFGSDTGGLHPSGPNHLGRIAPPLVDLLAPLLHASTRSFSFFSP